MLDFADSPGPPEAALWGAVLWQAWADLQHPNARIRRDAEAFFAGPGFDRLVALALLEADAIALIREAARQRALGHDPPVSKFARKPTRTYQQRAITWCATWSTKARYALYRSGAGDSGSSR
jgi:hypothetical protein